MLAGRPYYIILVSLRICSTLKKSCVRIKGSSSGVRNSRQYRDLEWRARDHYVLDVISG
jgi:hypothetical protein